MIKVFVSYSSLDLSNVAVLQQSLVGTGVKVFVAEHSVRPSEGLSERISVAIAACDLFVLLWSSNAKASEWVSQEIGKAHSLNKRILPLVFTEGLKLPGFISDLKYLAVYKNPAAAMKRTRSMILEELRTKQATIEKQKQNEALVLLGLGAFVLWAFSQK
jgi:hypothetical protein